MIFGIQTASTKSMFMVSLTLSQISLFLSVRTRL